MNRMQDWKVIVMFKSCFLLLKKSSYNIFQKLFGSLEISLGICPHHAVITSQSELPDLDNGQKTSFHCSLILMLALSSTLGVSCPSSILSTSVDSKGKIIFTLSFCFPS